MIQQRSAFILFFVILFRYNGSSVSLPTNSLCTELGVYEVAKQSLPRSGSQLPYCRTSDLQCCTTSYLDDLRSKLSLNISTGAQTDLMKALKPWQESYIQLTDSLNSFVTQFIDSYPFPHSVVEKGQEYLNSMKPILREQLLPTNAVNMSYDFTEFVSELAFNLIDIFVHNPLTNDDQRACLSKAINDEIKPDVMENIGEAITELQKVYQSFKKIGTFFNTASVDELGYTPSEQCIEAVVTQRCEQCKTNIPTLCEGVCTSLIIGCLSPLQDGLQSQIEVVWNITRQLALQTKHLMEQVLRIYQPLILTAASLQIINQNLMASPECEDLNIYFLLGIIGKRKRDASTSPIPLPSGLESAVQKVLLFEGLFIFNGNYIPSYCTDFSSHKQCWNGKKQIDNGTVTSDSILKPDIADQENNPVHQFDLYQLYQQAASIRDVTSPFLQSPDLLNNLPASIYIPVIDPYKIPILPVVTPTTTRDSTDSIRSNTVNPLTTPIQSPTPAVKPPINNIAGSSVMLANTYYNTILMAVLSMVVIGKK